MKHILIYLIQLYQRIPGNFHNQCRFIPRCSDYAIEAISEYGCIKGGFLSMKRIFRCHPWGRSGYDPVPKRSETK